MIQTIIHYFLHLLFPVVFAWAFFRANWQKAYLLMLLTMLMDADHLLATPVFQANRCSIGFHVLHTPPAIAVYIAMLFLRREYRMLAVGFCLHIITDFIDCLFMYNKCSNCYEDNLINPVLKFVHGLL